MITITYGTARGTSKRQVEMAWAVVDGRRYEAESTTGAVHALCRLLVADGVPDQPWEVPGRMSGGSIAWMAKRMVREDDAGIRIVRWTAGYFARRKGKSGGSGGGEGPDTP